MRILAVFIDMLSVDYLHMVNPSRKETCFEKYIERMGGTLYANCYTPAPDTPRSSACMWSGLYPKRNGCNTRSKYPKHYLKGNNNLWDVLKENGYTINVFQARRVANSGELPRGFDEYYYDGTLAEFASSLPTIENQFVYLYLPDLHLMLDRYWYSLKGFAKSERFTCKLLDDFFVNQNPSSFDFIIFFSDHGFRVHGVKGDLIEKDRVNTLMYLKKKSDKDFKISNKLVSNLDLFPTICEIIGVETPNGIDGISLFSDDEHEYVLIEDHGNFRVDFNQIVDHWALVKEDIYKLRIDGTWSENAYKSGYDLQNLEEIIAEKLDDYADIRKQLHIKKTHGRFPQNEYSDGTKLEKNIYTLSIFKTIANIIYKIKIIVSK